MTASKLMTNICRKGNLLDETNANELKNKKVINSKIFEN